MLSTSSNAYCKPLTLHDCKPLTVGHSLPFILENESEQHIYISLWLLFPCCPLAQNILLGELQEYTGSHLAKQDAQMEFTRLQLLQ